MQLLAALASAESDAAALAFAALAAEWLVLPAAAVAVPALPELDAAERNAFAVVAAGQGAAADAEQSAAPNVYLPAAAFAVSALRPVFAARHLAVPALAGLSLAAPDVPSSAAFLQDAAALVPAVWQWTVLLSDVFVFQLPHNPGNRYPVPPDGCCFLQSVSL